MSRLNVLINFIHDYFFRNSYILRNRKYPVRKNHVNLHRWHMDDYMDNLGDYLSEVIVNYMKKIYHLDDAKKLKKTRHLYAVGSIICLGMQNATIWGSGYIKDRTDNVLYSFFCKLRRLDIRCVRGPETRKQLLSQGFKCPEIYGDPVILMPDIYNPKDMQKQRKYSIIKHHTDKSRNTDENEIDMVTTDYENVIDRIVESELIISSSLHGVILSEVYGVPAVLYIPDYMRDTPELYKYKDYYHSTGRYDFPTAYSIQEALMTKPCTIPDFSEMRKMLIETFPVDLWKV